MQIIVGETYKHSKKGELYRCERKSEFSYLFSKLTEDLTVIDEILIRYNSMDNQFNAMDVFLTKLEPVDGEALKKHKIARITSQLIDKNKIFNGYKTAMDEQELGIKQLIAELKDLGVPLEVHRGPDGLQMLSSEEHTKIHEEMNKCSKI